MKFSYRTDKNAKAVAAYYNKTLDSKLPYNVQAASDDEATLFVFDVLGWPFKDINSMIREVSALKTKNLLVRLNSPGGDPIDTFALYHALKTHSAKVTVRIEAMAASAASFLALAGDDVQAYPSSLMMIHNSWVVAIGNRYELQDTADILEKIDSNMLDIYTAKTKIGKREMSDMMKDETWLNAKEMKEKGFIDTILDGKGAKAAFDLSVFSNLPEEFKVEPGNTEHKLTERELEKALRDVYGLSQNKAKAILAGCKKADGDEDEAAKQAGMNELKAELGNILSRVVQ
jgi:ATP-dependent Clp protease, protease subunit